MVTVFWDKKYMLKRRKDSDTYLATFRRHRWNAQMTMKKKKELIGAFSFVTFIILPFQVYLLY